MDISKFLYKLLGGLLLFAIFSGMAGIGASSDRFSTRNPYLSLLKKMHFFSSRDYSTQMSREREREVMSLREKYIDSRRSAGDRLKDQRLMLAMQAEKKPSEMLPPAINAQGRNTAVREQLAEQYYKNRDTQERYRQLIDAQRLK